MKKNKVEPPSPCSCEQTQPVNPTITDNSPPLRDWNYPDLSRFRPENLWFENKDGERWVPTEYDLRQGLTSRPKGFDHMVTRSGCDISVTYLQITRSGSKRIGAGNSSGNPELARALLQKIDPFWKDKRAFEKALQIASEACERCMNILAHDCGLPWGYSRDSFQASKCKTSCQLCKPS